MNKASRPQVCKWSGTKYLGQVVQSWVKKTQCLVVWNLISDLKALSENSETFLWSTIYWFMDALKRMDKIIQKRLLNKGIKKPRLKSNSGVVLIGLQTTRPRPLAGKHCSKAKKHLNWSTNNESMVAGLWCQVKRTYSTPLKWVITTKCTILCPLRISWDTCLWFQWRTSLPFTDFKNIRTYKRKVFI